MPKSVQNSTAKQTAKQASADDFIGGMKADRGTSAPGDNSNNPSGSQLDKNIALPNDIDDVFDAFDNNFGSSGGGGEHNVGIREEHADNPTASAKATRSTSTESTDSGNGSSVDVTPSLESPITITHRSYSSISRRRHQPIHQMASISEQGNILTSEHSAFEDGNEFVEDFFIQGNNSNNNEISENDDLPATRRSDSLHEATSPIASVTTSSSFSTPRRRIRASGESAGSAGNSSSTGSGRRSRGSGGRRRRGRRLFERSTGSADGENTRENNDDDNDDDTRRRRGRRGSGSGNTLAASLDAGMMTLRRWVRARGLSFGSGAGTENSSGGRSVSSMRLGEEDVFALSYTGSDPRRVTTTASSISSDPNAANIFESNSSNGFLYYRPFEVHVRNDVDADSGLYGSDDELSGTRSILLHPLVPSTESSLDEDGQRSRQRALSEPDRVRVRDFFRYVYGARAIDGGNSEDVDAVDDGRRSNRGGRALRPVVETSQIIIEEETDVTEQENNEETETTEHPLTRLQLLSPMDDDGRHVSALEAHMPISPSSGTATEAPPILLETGGANDDDRTDSIVDDTPDTSTPSDPNRLARTRWIRINRRFRCMITSVAILFSLLLFFIVIAWVLFTATYVISHNKECDVPLRGYYWLATIQLLFDIFRSDIMRWLCRWRSDSGRRLPPRVIMYNVAYLGYAIFVLRLGVRSVFIAPQTCSATAPELFYTALIFVSISLTAWATILLGYLIPFCFVAVLLTRNGYFPNGDITSSRGIMGGRRARGLGTGRISDMVGEVFPNTYQNPAPPGCVEQLRVVLLNEFPNSYQKECCICMSDYKEGEVIVATPCQPCEHIFHKRCCQEWLQLSRTCPVCRTDLPEALGISEHATESVSGSEEMQRRVELPNFVRFGGGERRRAADDTSNIQLDV